MIFHRSTILSGAVAVKLLLVVAGSLFLALAACRRHPDRRDPFRDVKVEDWQKTQAEAAAIRLREIFNSSACQPIYDAAAAYFRANQDSIDWNTECEQLKKQLGSWQSFQVAGTERCGMPEVLVCVGGPAAFEKGNKQIYLAWLLTQTGPQLFWIAIQEDEQHWKQIPPAPLLHPLMDPLPLTVTRTS
jgi:hypothetical protein